MEPIFSSSPLEDYFINESLLSSQHLAFQNKILPINLFSFKHRNYQMELNGENSEFNFKGDLSFEKPEITIGRLASNRSNDWNFPADDEFRSISREQASLILEYENVYLKNLSRANPTAFGIRTSSGLDLKDGQKIKIGRNIMMFSFPEECPEKLKYAIYSEEEDETQAKFEDIEWETEGGVKIFPIKRSLFHPDLRENVKENHAYIQLGGKKLKFSTYDNKTCWALLEEKEAIDEKLEIKGKLDLMLGKFFFTLTKKIIEKPISEL